MRTVRYCMVIWLALIAVAFPSDSKTLKKRRAMVKEFDLDGDKLLNVEEYINMVQQQGRGNSHKGIAWHRNNDLNGDGFVSAEEMAGREAGRVAERKAAGTVSSMGSSSLSVAIPAVPEHEDRPGVETPSAASGIEQYSSWLQMYALTSDGEEDPDADGLTSLVEYAFGSNPIVQDADRVLPEAGTIRIGSGKKNVCSFRRRRDAEQRGLKYVIGFSGGKAGSQQVVELNVEPIDKDFEKVTILVPKNSAVQLSVRIE